MSPLFAVPAALDNLIAAARAGMPGVQVVDGPPTSDFELPVRALIVGGSEDPQDVLAVEGQPAERGLGPRAEERFTVLCNLVVWDGGADADLAAARRTLFSLLEQLEQVLAGDRTLGGAVARASLTPERNLGQQRTPDGVGVVLATAIACTHLP